MSWPAALDRAGSRGPEYVVEFLNSVRKFDLQGRVRLVPFGVSVAPYLSAADLHTSPSSLEAYPLNTLEAMSLGIPVVATAAGGTEEQFPLGGLPVRCSFCLVRNISSSRDFLEAVARAAARRGARLRQDGRPCAMLLHCPPRNVLRQRPRGLLVSTTTPPVSPVVRYYWAQMNSKPLRCGGLCGRCRS